MAHGQDIVSNVITLDGTAWIEIAVAFLVYFVVSFLWWGPLFGKTWARHMKMDPDMSPSAADMAKPMLLQAVGTFLTVFVFWHVTTAFTTDLEGDHASSPTLALALQGAFWAWLGFFLPLQLGRAAWERNSWGLVGINAGGHLVALLATGAVFALL